MGIHSGLDLRPIVGVVYGAGDTVDLLLVRLAARLSAEGVKLAGLVQHAQDAPGRSRCTMVAEVLSTGERVRLSEDRGAGARGCLLDHGLLQHALSLAEEGLAGADLLILNRFGKVEAEGGGGRALMAAAMSLGLPVLVAVPWRNIAAFRAFAGELAQEVAAEALPGLLAGRGFALATAAGANGGRTSPAIDR